VVNEIGSKDVRRAEVLSALESIEDRLVDGAHSDPAKQDATAALRWVAAEMWKPVPVLHENTFDFSLPLTDLLTALRGAANVYLIRRRHDSRALRALTDAFWAEIEIVRVSKDSY
jgi:hypothetical protein